MIFLGHVPKYVQLAAFKNCDRENLPVDALNAHVLAQSPLHEAGCGDGVLHHTPLSHQ